MNTIRIGPRELEYPLLVASVSSYETPVAPFDALQIENLLQEPITLVSAFDVHFAGEKAEKICLTFRKTGAILLDSGGYESHRHSKSFKYLPSFKANHQVRLDELWDRHHFLDVARKDIYDLAFSFDVFPSEGESLSEYQERLLQGLSADLQVIDEFKFIPVIHLRTRSGLAVIDESDVVMLCERIRKSLNPVAIAVPEREFEAGIVERARIIAKVARHLREQNCKLHILGTGNPLSFAFLAVAGVTLADGLEWCRTTVDEHYHLHHFQHLNVFEKYVPEAEDLASPLLNTGVPYNARVLITNLQRLRAFGAQIRAALPIRSVHEIVRANFGTAAGDAISVLENEA